LESCLFFQFSFGYRRVGTEYVAQPLTLADLLTINNNYNLLLTSGKYVVE